MQRSLQRLWLFTVGTTLFGNFGYIERGSPRQLCIKESIREIQHGHSFGQFLDEQLLPDMNPFNGENPRSVLVMGEHCIIT